MKNKKIVLAGATGYLGKHVAKELMKQQYPATILVRDKSKVPADLKKLETLVAEVTKPDTLNGVMDNADVVVSTIGITKQKDGLTYMDVDYQANLNLLNEAKKAGVTVIETDGNGYHEDVQQAVQKVNLVSPVLVISSDLPLLTGEFLDEIISKYEQSGKPALTIMIPEEAFHKFGLEAVSLYEHKGKMYAVSGINIIDGKRILEEQEQDVVSCSRPEAVFTVNSLNDLETVKQYETKTKEN